jgi:hypothetical protein
MQLSEALRLVRRFEPEAMLHRDHICSEVTSHSLAHCPKMLSQIYAWRVESNLPAKRVLNDRTFDRDRDFAEHRGATDLS